MFQLKAFDELSWKGMTLNQICSVKMAKRQTRIARIRISVHNRSNMFWQRFGMWRPFVTLVCCVFCRRPFVLTPLKKGSPYDAATLGFLLLGGLSFRTQRSFHNRKFPVERRSKELACDVSRWQGQWDHPCTYYITIRREWYLRL